MTVEERTMERVNRLIEKGHAVLNTHRANPPNVIGFPTLDHGLYSEWRSQSLAALRDIVGADHTYSIEFDKTTQKEGYTANARAGIGILRSLNEDIQHGYLSKIKTLVMAEVFSDLLAMAQHLVERGYIHPAASLTGAVLENGLRRIGASQGVKVRDKDDLSVLNQKCAQHDIYSVLIRKKIDQWTHLRNQADHGRFNEYGEQDVKYMHRGVSEFLERYLA